MPDRLHLSSAERLAVVVTAAAAALIVAAYLIDRAGGSFRPAVMLAIGAGTAAALWLLLRRSQAADDSREATLTFAAIVGATLCWLLWIARPSFFPLGTGPDLTHHLLLIGFIEQHWRLVHDPAVERFLGEMVHYTPGSQILSALAGAWSGSNGLHALHFVLSASVALSAGFTFLIGLRALPADVPRVPLAAAGTLFLFASQTFLLGPFLEYSFVAQVVAQLFAVAMWWAIVVWAEAPSRGWSIMIGLLGAALFLTWPVLVGPPVLLLGFVTLLPARAPFVRRFASAAIAGTIVAVIAAMFFGGRSGWLQLAGTGGQTAVPSTAEYGAVFVALSLIGVAGAAFRREARIVLLFALAILVQSSALYLTATRAGNTPYMALKMFYLLLYAQAGLAAVGLGALWRLGTTRMLRASRPNPRLLASVAWAAALVVFAFTLSSLAGAPASLRLIHAPATTLPLEEAGRWARVHVPPHCIEYLVADDETAYWLHLAILENPRMSARTGDNSTFELPDSLVRWLTPGGLPYAIADLPRLPRDVRDELDIVAQFDTAAVAKRRGAASCPEP